MWNTGRIKYLRRRWADGASASVIALELGDVTRNAVIGKAQRLGLQRRDEIKEVCPRGMFKAVASKPLPPKPTAGVRTKAHVILRPAKPAEQSKAEIKREFESIWRNTVAIQNRMARESA